MIPKLTVLENIEEIKTIWNETVTNPQQCIDYAIKSIKKRILLQRSPMEKMRCIDY